jgi:hypothetical protein
MTLNLELSEIPLATVMSPTLAQTGNAHSRDDLAPI